MHLIFFLHELQIILLQLYKILFDKYNQKIQQHKYKYKISKKIYSYIFF